MAVIASLRQHPRLAIGAAAVAGLVGALLWYRTTRASGHR